MANLITIEQLLESVDLNFEPRWVTKDDDDVTIWAEKPTLTEGECSAYWDACCEYATLERLKLAEFADKDWQECIYEVPRKTTGKIKQIVLPALVDEQIEDLSSRDVWIHTIVDKITELVDAVNELKGAKNE